MSVSKIFPYEECVEIPISTFWNQFAFVINEVVPPEIVEKYHDKPVGVITNTLEELFPLFSDCFTLESMHDVFMTFSESQKNYVVSCLVILSIEISSISEDTLVLVPDDPKQLVKPFFAGKLHLYDILVK